MAASSTDVRSARSRDTLPPRQGRTVMGEEEEVDGEIAGEGAAGSWGSRRGGGGSRSGGSGMLEQEAQVSGTCIRIHMYVCMYMYVYVCVCVCV
jgi:hypothetical protein